MMPPYREQLNALRPALAEIAEAVLAADNRYACYEIAEAMQGVFEEYIPNVEQWGSRLDSDDKHTWMQVMAPDGRTFKVDIDWRIYTAPDFTRRPSFRIRASDVKITRAKSDDSEF